MKKHRLWILTLFPEFFAPLLSCGITGQALRGERDENAGFEIKCVNIRDFAKNKYKSVDDSPYGGGPGMVIRADVLEAAFREGVVQAGHYSEHFKSELHVVCPSPRGKVWNNLVARHFAGKVLESKNKDVVFVCGRYEGIDERFLESYVDEFYSVGDYVLTGGELAVMLMLDSSLRFVSGILGNKLSSTEDSFEDGLIECPQYTRPADFNGQAVPEVLSQGNHALIKKYQHEEKVRLTKKLRPDLWQEYERKKV